MRRFLLAAVACVMALSVFTLAGCGGAPAGPSLKVGDTVTMGNFKNKDLEWVVLDVQDKKALVVTKANIGRYQFNAENPDADPHGLTVWETSTLREFLNGDFLSKAFSADDAKKIAESDVVTGSVTTKDKVFILSKEDNEKYFADDAARADAENNWIFTRTPVNDTTVHMWIVYGAGDISKNGGFEATAKGGIRPAMWITA